MSITSRLKKLENKHGVPSGQPFDCVILCSLANGEPQAAVGPPTHSIKSIDRATSESVDAFIVRAKKTWCEKPETGGRQ